MHALFARTRSLALTSTLVMACGDDSGEDGGTHGESATETSTSTGASSSTAAPSSTTDIGTETATTSDATDETTAATTDDGSSEGSTGADACTLTNEWVLVDDHTGAASTDAQARGSTADADGRVYVVGLADGLWTVRRSDDGIDGWQTIDAFELTAGNGALAVAAAVADDGTIYVVGSAIGADGSALRLVRRSTDDASTWQTVESFQLEAGVDTYASAIAVAPDGTVYASGQAGSATASHWTIRTSTDGGDTWQTDSDFQLAPGHACLPHGMHVDDSGIVRVAGMCEDAAEGRHAIVRERDAAGSWSTIDDVAPTGTGGSSANGITALGDRVLVTHSAQQGGDPTWTIRARVGQGRWSTIDELSEAGVSLGVAGIVDDGAGTLVAAGTRSDPEPHTLTRRSDDDGVTWETIDEYAYEAGIYGGGLSRDVAGNLYTVGIGLTAGGIEHWIVRRMACGD
jgi:hypothetical protein